MKRIPTGILFVMFALTAPLWPNLQAEESAEQLADETLGSDQKMQDESAAQLSNQNLGPDQKMQDESAGQLSNQNLGPDQKMQNESAGDLAEQQGLEEKSIITAAQPSQLGTGEGVNGVIYAIVAQPDNSVIIGGRFESVNGQPRQNLARFNADGTLDAQFLAAPTDGVKGTVYALALDAKGNLLVAGYFTTVQDQPQQNFVRYLANGKLDPSFGGGQGPNGTVYAITVQPKGQIVIGGEFSQVDNKPRRNLARFNVDGTLDGPVSSADVSTGSIRSLTALAAGGIIAGGHFEISGQTARNLLTVP